MNQQASALLTILQNVVTAINNLTTTVVNKTLTFAGVLISGPGPAQLSVNNPSGDATVTINSTAAHNSIIGFYTASVRKWALYKDSSDSIVLLDDAAGTNALSFINNGGQCNINRDVIISVNDAHQLFVDNPSGQYSALDLSHAGAIKSQFFWDNTNAFTCINTVSGFIALTINGVAALTAFNSGGVGVGAGVADPGAGGIQATNLFAVNTNISGIQIATITTLSGTSATIGGTSGNWSYIITPSGAFTLTTTPSALTGRVLRLTNRAAFTISSNTTNVVPLAGGASAALFLPATAGKWGDFISDGTNWQQIAGN